MDAHLVLSMPRQKGRFNPMDSPVLVMDSRLGLRRRSTGRPSSLACRPKHRCMWQPNIVLHQMPVAGGQYVTRIFGLGDDPKKHWDSRGATFMNRTWERWLVEAGVTPEQCGRTPCRANGPCGTPASIPSHEREESLRLALPLQDPASAPTGWLSGGWPRRGSRWQKGRPRLTARGCWLS